MKERLARLNKDGADVLQPLAYIDDEAQPRSAMGQAAFKAVSGDYIANFPAAPESGATAGIPDGAIMIELEKLGNDLSHSMSKVAEAVGVKVSDIVMRVYVNPVLMEFYKTIRRARAQLVREERDRLTQKLCDMADTEELTLSQFKTYSLRIQTLDKDLKYLDRELFGSGEKPAPKLTARNKNSVIEAQAEVIPEISTSLSNE